MLLSNMPTGSSARAAIRPRCSTNGLANIIEDEAEWRVNPALDSSAPRVVATRWQTVEDRVREVSAKTADDWHVVKIVLRNMNCRFSVSGRIVQDGVVAAGMLHVTEPAAPTRCLFRGPYDTLHLHVPNRLIAECSRDVPGGQPAILRSEPTLTRDPVVDRLGRALLAANEVGDPYGPLYAETVSLAIVARLVASAHRARPSERVKAARLATWRLRRAIEYIEVHLGQPVSLADVASAAGLSRMHFAAQFKVATGLRPHEYLLRRRIERAQEMLAGDEALLVDVALTVGFQTQSHFTTVFKRVVGQPPYAWRRSHRHGEHIDRRVGIG